VSLGGWGDRADRATASGALPEFGVPCFVAARRANAGGNTTSVANGSSSTFDASNRPPSPCATSPYTVPDSTSPTHCPSSRRSSTRPVSVDPSSENVTSSTDDAWGESTRTGTVDGIAAP
jgi:hypothetical protein